MGEGFSCLPTVEMGEGHRKKDSPGARTERANGDEWYSLEDSAHEKWGEVQGLAAEGCACKQATLHQPLMLSHEAVHTCRRQEWRNTVKNSEKK